MKPLPLKSPCAASWDDMLPASEGRHCASCDRVVHDLRRYSEARVLALTTLLAPTGFCARQTLDEHGELVLASGDVHRARAPRWAGSTLALLSVAGCATTTGTTATQRTVATAPAATAPAAADCAPELVLAAAPPGAQQSGLPNTARAGVPSAAASTPQPAADRDGDGVPDGQDRCPDERGAPPEGCPGSTIRVGGIAPSVRAQIWFGSRSTKIDPKMQPLLTEIAAVMRSNPSIQRVAIVGHAAKEEGRESAARALGLQRAEAVRAALLSLGIEPERLTSASWGSEHPNLGPEHQSGSAPDLNRRVEFLICPSSACDSLPSG